MVAAGLGSGHLLIVLVVIVLVFGTKKLRDVGGDLGAALRDSRTALGSDTPAPAGLALTGRDRADVPKAVARSPSPGADATIRAGLPVRGRRRPVERPPMINAFELQQGRLRQIPIDSAEDLERCRPVWVDLAESTEQERAWAQSLFGVALPEEEELGDIESSARFFEGDNGELHIRSDFLHEGEMGGESIPAAFILKGEVVFSVHAVDLPQFRLVRFRARRQPGFVGDAKDVLLEIYAADAEFSADVLEEIYGRLDDFSERVLRASLTDEEAGAVLTQIAKEEDLAGHIRRNLMDTRRAVSFLMRKRLLNAEQNEDARQILRDIGSLEGHTDFLFDKLNFLMDATVGFININQNKIIKIFSVASVAMLPPTLVASVYGMNFERFPELRWEYGYPFALALMAVSVALPFWYFHRKGWLK